MKPRSYLLAIGLPLLLKDGLLVSGVHLLAGGPVELVPSPWWHYVANALVVLFLAGSLEEFGWRGFAQPRLQQRISAFTAALGIGLAWALRHLPLFYLYDVPAYDPAGFWTTHLGSLLLSSVLYAWLYNGSGGSLLLPMVAHALGDMPALAAPVGEIGLGADYALEVLGCFLSWGCWWPTGLATSPGPDPSPSCPAAAIGSVVAGLEVCGPRRPIDSPLTPPHRVPLPAGPTTPSMDHLLAKVGLSALALLLLGATFGAISSLGL